VRHVLLILLSVYDRLTCAWTVFDIRGAVLVLGRFGHFPFPTYHPTPPQSLQACPAVGKVWVL